MARSITVEAADGDITTGDVEGIIGMIRRLHESSDIESIRVEIDATKGLLDALSDINQVSIDGEETGDEESTTAEVVGDGESAESEDEEEEGGDEEVEVESPTLADYDDPEEAGRAWQEYHEKTGNVPRLNSDAKYYRVAELLMSSDEPLTSAELVELADGEEFDLSQSQVSSHLYNLLQKGVVSRDKPEGTFKYSLTELGGEAMRAA